jgi:hypothetical protein
MKLSLGKRLVLIGAILLIGPTLFSLIAILIGHLCGNDDLSRTAPIAAGLALIVMLLGYFGGALCIIAGIAAVVIRRAREGRL